MLRLRQLGLHRGDSIQQGLRHARCLGCGVGRYPISLAATQSGCVIEVLAAGLRKGGVPRVKLLRIELPVPIKAFQADDRQQSQVFPLELLALLAHRLRQVVEPGFQSINDDLPL